MTKVVTMAEAAFEELAKTVGNFPAETCGWLFQHRRSKAQFHIDAYWHDYSAISSREFVQPQTQPLNNLLERAYMNHGLDVVGHVHSHPAHVSPARTGLSLSDFAAAKSYMANFRKHQFYFMWVVQSTDDHPNLGITPHCIHWDNIGNPSQFEIQIV